MQPVDWVTIAVWAGSICLAGMFTLIGYVIGLARGKRND